MYDIVINSARLKNGDIFFCDKNAERYLNQDAIQKASKIFVNKDFVNNFNEEEKFIRIDNFQETLIDYLKKRYQLPKKLIGITGSKGKTSVAWFIFSLLSKLGYKVSYFGTIGLYYSVEKDIIQKIENNSESLTTLMIDENYQNLSYVNNLGIEYAILEVSSHSLVQNRVGGLKFDYVAFTSFSQDHLDFHKNMEDYFNAKCLLFEKFTKENTLAFINSKIIDQEKLKTICKKQNINYKIYGSKYEDDIKILSISSTLQKQECNFSNNKQNLNFFTNIIGDVQIENLICAFAICNDIIKNDKILLDVVSQISAPNGRMQRVRNTNIFIDYAHTPQSLESTLITVNKVKNEDSKIHLIFGCGGDRDKLKRPLMGLIGLFQSDYLYITNDNPRTEKDVDIICDILCGFENFILEKYFNNNNDLAESYKTYKQNSLMQNLFVQKEINIIKDKYYISQKDYQFEIIKDRKLAIQNAMTRLKTNDILIIAGKGHENYQIIGKEKFFFSDYECVLNYLKK